ncbi:class I SAM-dependent methyltransferase [Nocardioides pantholopis]|uniref:methyltransferase domain-containing protein n=1 Tax=Nocardioides pantholopis TaxID=2483798 RepID=UPI000F08ED7A|nr:class I SAM-dependent methyltransferase [Nocardioides pantholopis]
MTLREESFTSVFAQALRGEPCRVHGLAAEPERLPVTVWSQEAGPVDREMLSHCVGPTLDVGCGPGRMAAQLLGAGHVVLGIDVVPEAVWQTRGRGVVALHRDVFDPVPGEGRWQTALLADGNVGIGGDPVALLSRVRELLGPRGRVVAELAGPGVPMSSRTVRLECAGAHSRPFSWAVVGTDDAAPVAAAAGLAVRGTHGRAGRWWAVLEREGDRSVA